MIPVKQTSEKKQGVTVHDFVGMPDTLEMRVIAYLVLPDKIRSRRNRLEETHILVVVDDDIRRPRTGFGYSFAQLISAAEFQDGFLRTDFP